MRVTTERGHAAIAPGRLTAGLALGLTVVALALPASAARKCVDAQGRELYTDQKCPPETEPRELDRPLQIIRNNREKPPEAHPRAPEALPPAPPPPAEAHPRTPRSAPQPGAPLMAKAIVGARFAQALSDLSALKTYSLMHFAENGSWPQGPEQLGLDPTSFYTNEIVEVAYRRDGGIVAYLAPSFGHGKWILLQPQSTLGGANVRWACGTSLERSAVHGIGASCKWEPPRSP